MGDSKVESRDGHRAGGARRGRVAMLVGVNAILVGGLAMKWSPMAWAQDRSRPRGEYTMVSGRLPSGGPEAIYVVDAANEEIVALRWDNGRQALVGIGYSQIGSEAEQDPGR
ncbi:MAG: hypothetical protein IPK69_08040 [Phycisphaerales bacterium]|nr:MAG: hypothetical protein IPK69_08040 [Phycisphaerales bacterium]